MLPSDEEKPLFRRFEVGNDFLTGVDAVLGKYFSIQSALAGDDFATAKSEAASFGKTLEEMPPPQLETAAAIVWIELRDRLSAETTNLAAAPDIKVARVAFEPLSIATDEMVQQFGTKDLSAFKAHCPMALDGKGADWLQSTDDLLNPYFGAAMLKCGEIKEQLTGPIENATIPDKKAE